MLSRAEIERLSTTVSRGNAGQAETLYLQDIILDTVNRETADELVFKGGTALLKFYQLDRFSENLDFTARAPVDLAALVDSAVRSLENYGATVEDRRTNETDTTRRARLGIRGPLFTGDRRSLCFVRLEIHTGSSVVAVRTRRYTPQFPDIASFELAVLDAPEILAEKIRALLTRHQPRDLYDSYHLLEASVAIDPALVRDKLDYYDLEYDPAAVVERAEQLDRGWGSLEPLVYSSLPPFDTAVDALERGLAAAGTSS